ncbi:MAG: KOW domain-containing RNA-binding protein [Clostridiales bacterium]|nr:KOW domain-containing RNA-binding protein [Clostridiales bacterium]
MKPEVHQLGRVVLSKQGHDKGKAFLVVGLLDEKHVLIADGGSRKLCKPKKKQAKHLTPKPWVATEILASIRDRAQTADSDIRKALRTYLNISTRPQDKEDHTFV